MPCQHVNNAELLYLIEEMSTDEAAAIRKVRGRRVALLELFSHECS